MDKDKSELEEFMGSLGSAGDKDPMLDKGEDPFAHLEEEKAPEKVEEEKPLPFNKDPKIQKFIDKEISKRLAEFKPEAPRETQSEVDSFKDVIDSFTAIVGNDTPEKIKALDALQKSLNSLDQRASQKAIQALEGIKQEELQADQKAEQELESAFDNIEKTFDVDITSNNPTAIKTRKEFVSFVEKIAPKDRNGDIVDYPDMTSAWETFSAIKKSTATPSRAKELASRSMTRSAETTSEPTIKRGGAPFANSDAFIESLSK
jgi:hypothetical protein